MLFRNYICCEKELTLANAAGYYALLHCPPMQPKLNCIIKYEFFATYELRKTSSNNLKMYNDCCKTYRKTIKKSEGDLYS
jgi:hypothetical protein